MNWEAIGAIAELLGALAVLCTLIYLAVQIRQSNIITREQAHYHMLSNQTSYFDRLAENPDLVKAAYGAHLSDIEIAFRQHEANVCAILFRWNWEYVRVQEGIYGVMDIPLEGFRWQYKTIGIDEHWSEKKTWFDPRFVEFMEANVIPHTADP